MDYSQKLYGLYGWYSEICSVFIHGTFGSEHYTWKLFVLNVDYLDFIWILCGLFGYSD